MNELERTAEKEKLAELGASLLVWLVITILVYLFLHGWFWWIVKFFMTVIFIYGVRDFFIGYQLLAMKQKVNEGQN